LKEVSVYSGNTQKRNQQKYLQTIFFISTQHKNRRLSKIYTRSNQCW